VKCLKIIPGADRVVQSPMRALDKVAVLPLACETLLEEISESIFLDTVKRGVEQCTPKGCRKWLAANHCCGPTNTPSLCYSL
jgi:hypothetical protein